MVDDDPFSRRTATPEALIPWLGRVARDIPAQIGLYAPRAALDRGLREKIMMAVTDVNECRWCSWIHGGWKELLDRGPKARDDIALAYARGAAETGKLPPSEEARTALQAVFSPSEVRAIDAAISGISVANLAGNTVDGLIARFTGARPRDPAAMVQEAAVVAAAAPVGLPLLALGALFQRAERALPRLDVELKEPPGSASMGVLMLAEVVKRWRDYPVVRALGASGPIAIGAEAEGMSATVRFKGSTVEVENGLAEDVVLVVQGDMETMIEAATDPARVPSLLTQGRLTTRVP